MAKTDRLTIGSHGWNKLYTCTCGGSWRPVFSICASTRSSSNSSNSSSKLQPRLFPCFSELNFRRRAPGNSNQCLGKQQQ
ncbi:hypothetical protein Emag_002922 [Eimeria magna]